MRSKFADRCFGDALDKFFLLDTATRFL